MTLQAFFTQCGKQPPQMTVLDKVGEGTFAAVYQCKGQLPYVPNESYKNAVDRRYYAVKCIYQQSDERRIMRELEFMFKMRGSPNVIDILDIHRIQDQTYVVMPFVKYHEFKSFYSRMTAKMAVAYMRQLLIGVRSIHHHHVIHRDIKPSNFLYNCKVKEGCLADFGLAQIDSTTKKGKKPQFVSEPSIYDCNNGVVYIDQNETRPSLRADRAGTRGFRAPEVLLKWPYQTTKIDMWSVGVILLCIMSRRYPFFHSTTDEEALLEIAHVVGSKALGDYGQRIGSHGSCRSICRHSDTLYHHGWHGLETGRRRGKSSSTLDPRHVHSAGGATLCG